MHKRDREAVYLEQPERWTPPEQWGVRVPQPGECERRQEIEFEAAERRHANPLRFLIPLTLAAFLWIVGWLWIVKAVSK